MPRYERYPDESPVAARRRISKNIAKDKGNPGVKDFSPVPKPPKVPPRPRAKNPDEIKTKADLLAGNLGSTIKNMGGGY
jgi:hypothetical protein